MGNLKAICTNCGFNFNSPIAIASEGPAYVNNVTTFCPKCGGLARIPDGVYRLIDDAVQFLTETHRTAEELQNFTKLIKEAREKQLSRDAINNRIQKEVPGLSSFKDILPKTTDELYSFLTLLITLISLILQISSNRKEALTQKEIHELKQRTFQQIIIQEQNININVTNNQVINLKNKIGRNEKCPCGSDMKYKRCHGK